MRVYELVINICNLSLIRDSRAGFAEKATVLMSEARISRFDSWPQSRPDIMNAVTYGQ